MPLTRASLTERISKLKEQREQLLANAHATAGALAQAEWTLTQLDESSETDTAPATPADVIADLVSANGGTPDGADPNAD